MRFNLTITLHGYTDLAGERIFLVQVIRFHARVCYLSANLRVHNGIFLPKKHGPNLNLIVVPSAPFGITINTEVCSCWIMN